MIQYRLKARNKPKLIGVYSPHVDPSIFVRTLIGWQHYRLDATAKAMTTVLLQHAGYDINTVYTMLEGYDDTDTCFDVPGTTLADMLTAQLRLTLGTDVWLKVIDNQLQQNRTKNAVITGLQYPNEYHWLKWQDAYMVAIIDPAANPERLHSYTFDQVLTYINDWEYRNACKKTVTLIDDYFST